MPVLIHHNIAGSYMAEPIYLKEMQEALASGADAPLKDARGLSLAFIS